MCAQMVNVLYINTTNASKKTSMEGLKKSTNVKIVAVVLIGKNVVRKRKETELQD